MAEYAYKMFNRDLTCTKGRGRFQYEENVWMEEPEANCVKNGFHCAKNPLDCLTYYPDWEKSVCYMVEIGGDIDEDACDSKISCTRMRLDRKLSLKQFVSHACLYMIQHPDMPVSHLVDSERAEPGRYHFCIARGKNPAAKGKIGDVIGIVQEAEEGSEIDAAGVFVIDGEDHKPDVWYDAMGRSAG